jgi:hypothetical protein
MPTCHGTRGSVNRYTGGSPQHPQADDGEFAFVAAVGGQLPALAVQDDLLAAVVGLHHVQTLVDLPLQVPVAQLAGHYVESNAVKSCRSTGGVAILGVRLASRVVEGVPDHGS